MAHSAFEQATFSRFVSHYSDRSSEILEKIREMPVTLPNGWED
jgi:hypothetical protein